MVTGKELEDMERVQAERRGKGPVERHLMRWFWILVCCVSAIVLTWLTYR